MVKKAYIIPSRFFDGDLGNLRKQDPILWEALVDRDRMDWEARQKDVEEWFRQHDRL